MLLKFANSIILKITGPNDQEIFFFGKTCIDKNSLKNNNKSTKFIFPL